MPEPVTRAPQKTRTMVIRRAVAAALTSVIVAGCTGLDGPSASPSATTAGEPATPALRSASPAPMGALARGGWVGVTVDGAELRDAPGEEGVVIGLLPAGATGLIIGDSVEVEGAAWVPVAAPGLPYDAGCVGTGPPIEFDLNCPLWRGWLAATSPGGGQSLVRAELDCPGEPRSANELLAIPLGVSVACLGGETLTIRANLSPDMRGAGCPPENDAIPAWMHPCAQLFFPSRTGDGLQGLLGMLHPSVATCESWSDQTCPIAPLIGESVEVRGSFDHPEAASCDESTPEVDLRVPAPVFIEYFCRTRFVITGLEPAN